MINCKGAMNVDTAINNQDHYYEYQDSIAKSFICNIFLDYLLACFKFL